MGSGISACTGPSSVGITTDDLRQRQLNKSGGVHSDSCDSGISVSEGNRKNRTTRHGNANVTSRRVQDSDEEEEEEEEEAVQGSDVACGPDFVMTSTPRGLRDCGSSVDQDAARSIPRPHAANPHHRASVVATTNVNTKTLRHNPCSAPNLLDHAIHEEDEEHQSDYEREPEDKRLKAQRPPRPKTAHFRKSRAPGGLRGRTARSRSHSGAMGIHGESSVDLSTDESEQDDIDEDDFDSDVLSIPDETAAHGPASRPSTLTTVKLGPHFQSRGDHDKHDASRASHTDDGEWWTEDDLCSARSRDGAQRVRQVDNETTCRSRGSSFRSKMLPYGVAKKASERSISSILLTPAHELDSSCDTPTCTATSPCSATNPECFAVTNPEITQHILKCIQEIEQDLKGATFTLCAKEDVTRGDYFHVVTSLRPRFLRLLGDFKMATGEVLGRLPVDCQRVIQLEEDLADRMLAMANNSRSGALELSPLVTQHLQDLEELCEKEGTRNVRSPFRPLVMPPNRQQANWDESGVEDESDSTEEDLLGNGDFAQALNHGNHDNHVIKSEEDKLSSLPPKGACKSARPPSLASKMSSRTRSSARRPPTENSVLSGSKVQTVVENEDSEGSNSTITATHTSSTTPSTTLPGSRCSTSVGGRKSRPDSGIVVSSCSASYSSSEATRETDADLAAQTEWIATSLEMLEQILQVRTESHETMKSLVDTITKASTSEQLKAHALYRWLASQSMAYYAKCKTAKSNSPTGKLRQLAEGKICYATLYQEMAKAAGLKCEKIEGYAKGPDYRPGTPIIGNTDNSNNPQKFKHSWNAILLNGHYHFLDSGFGALPCKFFVEHFFMTPPDEMRLSHFPQDKRWLLMTQTLSVQDFESTLKTWPTMFAFNIRPLNMQSVLRSYDGRLSITVLLRNVAVTPQLEYVGPGTPQDVEALAFNIDQEIRNVDNAETFHLNLPEEGTYFFTLMVHDLEEDEDIPAFQYRVEYKDELL